jgi:hypothetical protein
MLAQAVDVWDSYDGAELYGLVEWKCLPKLNGLVEWKGLPKRLTLVTAPRFGSSHRAVDKTCPSG